MHTGETIHDGVKDLVRMAFDNKEKMPRIAIFAIGILIGIYFTAHLMNAK